MTEQLTKQVYRDHTMYINNYDEIIEFAINAGCDVFTVPGTLLDHTLIYAGKSITLGKLKPRNYIIFTPEYLNEWSSTMRVTLTDKEEEYDSFMKMYDEYMDEEYY